MRKNETLNTGKPERTEVFAVHLTKEENRVLALAANEKGVTKSGYFRIYLLPVIRGNINGEL